MADESLDLDIGGDVLSIDLPDDEITLNLQPETLSIDLSGSAGPRGAKGDKGDTGTKGDPGPAGSTAVDVEAGEIVNGHRGVYVDDGKVYKASASITAHCLKFLGITTGAATPPADASVQFTGTMEEASWTFSPGPVYLGEDGLLTQSLVSGNCVKQVGVAITPTIILVSDFQELTTIL